MKKISKFSLLAAAAVAIAGQSTFAVSIEWVAGITAPEPPTSIGGYSVLEYRNAGNPWDGSGNNQWALGNDYADGGSGSWALWMMGGAGNWAATSFSVRSTAVAFAMEGDHNDGIAEFYVDGTLVETKNMHWLYAQSLVVSGLSDDFHTLVVRQTGTKDTDSSGTHAHVLGGAALAKGVPDAGGTLGLMLLGIASLFRFSRRD